MSENKQYRKIHFLHWHGLHFTFFISDLNCWTEYADLVDAGKLFHICAIMYENEVCLKRLL